MINIVMPLPGVSKTFTFKQLGSTVVYSLDTMIVLVMTSRVYHVFRLFA
jgi:hypothetical protein